MSYDYWPEEPEEKKHRPPKREELLKLHTINSLISINHSVRAYSDVGAYNKRKANTAFSWHLVTAHHESDFTKAQILRALNDVVGDCEFYPVAYKVGPMKDEFIIRNAKFALQKLFDCKLRIPIGKDQTLPLTVKLDVGRYEPGQIHPSERIKAAIQKQFQRLESTKYVPAILNLDEFAKLSQLEDICINLRNKSALDLVCRTIAQSKEIVSTIRGIRLTNNGITTLSSLQYLAGICLMLLDIRHNSIDNIEELNHLKKLSVAALYLAGNKCMEKAHYLYRTKEILPSLRMLDGIPATKIVLGRSATDRIELEYVGDVIKSNDLNKDFDLSIYKRSEMWHQVIVAHNGNYTKDVIVRSIYASFKRWNTPMFMCYYEIGKEQDSFLVRNSYEHLEIFVENRLNLKIIDDLDSVQMILRMNVSAVQSGHVDPVEAMHACIPERFNSKERVLNLQSFAKSKELKNVTLSLSSPAIVMTILIQCARRYATAVALLLNDNDIVSSKGMQAIPYFKWLKILNLSNNKIAAIEDLSDIPQNSYEEVYLDGNPLCQNYYDAEQYIEEVGGLFPELVKLDGVYLDATLRVQKNFLVSLESYSFVDSFVQLFFEAYDSECRPQLSEMYDENALLSVSFLWKDESFDEERMDVYNSISRNGLYTYSDEYVYFGPSDVKGLFESLPESEHDRFTFQIDCPIFSDDLVIITISGVFREKLIDGEDCNLILGFRRTFVLVPHNSTPRRYGYSCEYKIVNEQYHIQHPSEQQLRHAFKHKESKTITKDDLTAEDEELLKCIFQKLTCLKPLWCSKFLADAKWNFTKALEIYCNYKADRNLPRNAFLDGPVD